MELGPVDVDHPVSGSNDGGLPAIRGGNGGTDCWNPGEALIGPDVIVGDINGVGNYSAQAGVEAYAVGTTSCNIGSSILLWEYNTPDVPVIGQNMYRLKNGRFEQFGQSWLKYAFSASSWTCAAAVATEQDPSLWVWAVPTPISPD